MRSFLAATAVSLLTVGLIASASRAQPREPFTLEWRAPDECPSAEALRAAVRELLGPHPNTERPVSARASAYRGEDAAWHVEITTESRDATGERKIDGPSCRVVADAAALVVAMAVDPDAVAAHTALAADVLASVSASPPPAPEPPPSAPAPAPPSASSPSRPPAVPVPPAPPPDSPVRFGISARTTADVGALPSWSPGLGAGAVVVLSAWRFELSGQGFAKRSASVAGHPSAGGDFHLWTVGAEACHELFGTTLTGSLCAGFEAGRLSASGYGVRVPSETSPWWYAGTLTAAADWRLADALALRLVGGIAAPLERNRYVIDPYGSVHRPSPVSARFALGPVLLFP